MPLAFAKRFIFPDDYNIPAELQYDYMAYQLAKNYKISLYDALKYSELEYWKSLVFENLDSEREEFMRKVMSNE
jgi:hypothetical protein